LPVVAVIGAKRPAGVRRPVFWSPCEVTFLAYEILWTAVQRRIRGIAQQ
jgi:hypothetical protein